MKMQVFELETRWLIPLFNAVGVNLEQPATSTEYSYGSNRLSLVVRLILARSQADFFHCEVTGSFHPRTLAIETQLSSYKLNAL